jgi:autotransporter-associated beta strand protein
MGQSGPLSVGGASSLSSTGGDVTLNNAANSFGGMVSSSGGNITLFDSAGDLILGATTATGSLTVESSGGAIDQELPYVSGNAIRVSGAAAFTARNGSSSAAITLENPFNEFGGSVSLDGAAIAIADADSLVLGPVISTGLLRVTSHGSISQSDGWVVGGVADLNAGNGAVTLSDADNDFGSAVRVVTSGDVTLNDRNGLVLGTSTIGGNFNVTAAGTLSQSGPLSVVGTTGVSASGQAVTLSNAANSFGGAVTVSGGATSLRASGALTAVLTTTGSTSVNAGGNLNVSGSVSGAGSDLTTQSSGSGTTSFGVLSVGRNLTASSAGSMGQSGPLSVGGASSLSSTGGDVTLNNAGNSFVGLVASSGRDITLFDSAGDLVLGATTATGSFTVKTIGGDVSQSTPYSSGQRIVVSGDSSIVALRNGASSSIMLANPFNDFIGRVSVDGSAISIQDVNDLALGRLRSDASVTLISPGNVDLGTSTVGGSLAVTTQGGVIAQVGALVVSGDLSLDAGAGLIKLSHRSNQFLGSVTAVAAGTFMAGVPLDPVLAEELRILSSDRVQRSEVMSAIGAVDQSVAPVTAKAEDRSTSKSSAVSSESSSLSGDVLREGPLNPTFRVEEQVPERYSMGKGSLGVSPGREVCINPVGCGSGVNANQLSGLILVGPGDSTGIPAQQAEQSKNMSLTVSTIGQRLLSWMGRFR